MPNWKKGKDPILWPIDKLFISGVDFIAAPKTDVHSDMVKISFEMECERKNSESIGMFLEYSPRDKINQLINVLCNRLVRRTPEFTDYVKGELNTDVLRKTLEIVLSVNTDEGSREKTNMWGISYDILHRSVIDVEYETIFGDAKVILEWCTQNEYLYDSLAISVRCRRCSILRDNNGLAVSLPRNKLDQIASQSGPFAYNIDSLMEYEISSTTSKRLIHKDKFSVERQFEFIYDEEHIVFIEDGPKQYQLPEQNVALPLFDNAVVKKNETNVIIIIGGVEIPLKSKDDLKARLAELFFAKKNKYKIMELEDVYNKIGDSTKEWNGAISNNFTGSISAAIKRLNSVLAKGLGFIELQVIILKDKKVFINPDLLLPREKKKLKSHKK